MCTTLSERRSSRINILWREKFMMSTLSKMVGVGASWVDIAAILEA